MLILNRIKLFFKQLFCRHTLTTINKVVGDKYDFTIKHPIPCITYVMKCTKCGKYKVYEEKDSSVD